MKKLIFAIVITFTLGVIPVTVNADSWYFGGSVGYSQHHRHKHYRPYRQRHYVKHRHDRSHRAYSYRPYNYTYYRPHRPYYRYYAPAYAPSYGDVYIGYGSPDGSFNFYYSD